MGMCLCGENTNYSSHAPLHSVAFLGSGSHSPLLIQMDVLEPISVYPGVEQLNVTLLSGIAESTL